MAPGARMFLYSQHMNEEGAEGGEEMGEEGEEGTQQKREAIGGGGGGNQFWLRSRRATRYCLEV